MRGDERDNIVQHFILIKEKVKSAEKSMMPALKEIEMKIKELKEERESEKKAIIDYIDELKAIVINTPIERKEEKKERWYKKWI